MLNHLFVKLRYTLKKHQILRNKKEITYLFENGKNIVKHPLRVVYLLNKIKSEENPYTPYKILVSVPKKNIKKATQRNKVKRKIKESFRLQQYTLKIPSTCACYIAFVFIEKSTDDSTLSLISSGIQKAIEHISEYVDKMDR